MFLLSSYTPTGIGKAKSAMEAARAKKSKLMVSQKEENEFIQTLPEWAPGDEVRPSSDKVPPMSRQDKVCVMFDCNWLLH